MKKRTIKRRQSGAGFYKITAGEREYGMKIPLPMHASILAQAMTDKGLTGIKDIDVTTKEGAAIVAEMWSVGGACLGLSWYHETLDLESRRDLVNIEEYGDDVMRELMEHGITAEEINELFPAAYKECLSILIPEKEVAEHENFTDPTPGNTP